ncbi:hypothetical protein TNCV_4257111 [Trichonephila clavipes]|nr:hypothetical protein TNCV_4257111 [Trichonephila clavipes]
MSSVSSLSPPTHLGAEREARASYKWRGGRPLLDFTLVDENFIEIAVLPDANELTDENEGYENEVNTGEIIIKDVPKSLEVRSGDPG